jgi:hypothetical protein
VKIDTFHDEWMGDQEINSSIVTFSKKSFESILGISIIPQPIPQSPSLLAHQSVTHTHLTKNPFLLRSALAVSGLQHILNWLINVEELTLLTLSVNSADQTPSVFPNLETNPEIKRNILPQIVK